MYNEDLGKFRGRIEDCNKIQVSTAQLSAYLTNFAKRENDVKKAIEGKKEVLDNNPKLKEFVDKYLNSLGKMRQISEQQKIVQEEEVESQMSM